MKKKRHGYDKVRPEVDGKKITYAEALLMELVSELPVQEGRVLVAGNRSGVVVGELMTRWPDATVFAHAFDAHHARAIRKHLLDLKLKVRTVISTPNVLPPETDESVPEGERRYRQAFFMTTPRSMPAELVLDQLQDIFLSLVDGAEFWATFEGDPDEALRTMRLVWPSVHVAKKTKHAVLFRAVKKGEPVKTRAFASTWEASVPGGPELSFISLPGCFCHRRPDLGGLALAEVAAKEVEARRAAGVQTLDLLDMGCGCGLVGLLVADAWRRAFPASAPFTEANLKLTLIDSHARALEASRQNAARAGFAPELVLADDGLPRGRTGEYDYFVGNPPYYSEYRIAEVFLETAYRALKPGGVCLTVVKTATGLLALQEKYFRTVEVINRRGYCVLRSVR